jgi:uncharacterized protein YegL
LAFAKTADDALASLAKQIDKLVADNQEKKLAAVINFTGEPTDDYKAKVAEFATKHNLKNVALVVTPDADRMKINDQAEVTVMHYKGKSVKSNHAVAAGGLNAQAVKGIIEGAKTILE